MVRRLRSHARRIGRSKIDAADQRRVTDTLETAQKMGGLVFSMKGEDVAQALISFAREYGITHIVIGRPGRRRLKRLFKRALHEKLLEQLPDVDLVVV